MNSNGSSISIVIPAYNEQVCIAESLDAVMAFAAAHPGVREVIVVDDGSTDGTAAIITGVQARHTQLGAGPLLELLRNPRNLGKGATVRNGVLAARGDVVLFTDADLSAPMSEAPRLIDPIIAGEADVVVGSRALDRRLIGVHQGLLREEAGKVFNVIVRTLTGLPIRDTQCGFKAFRRSAMLPIFEMQRVGGFAFDVELLYLAAKRGLRIREVPVHWNHVAHTQVRLVRDSLRMFLDVLRIRFRARWNACHEHDASHRPPSDAPRP